MEILSKYTEITNLIAVMTTAWLVLRLLFGLLNCFLGYKLLKTWVACCGFLLGFAAGYVGGHYFLDRTGLIWGAALVGGVVLGVLAYEVYLVGAFLLGWLLTISAFFSLGRFLEMGDKMELLMLGAGATFGILVGALIVRFARPGIILLTAISGAINIGTGLTGLMKWENPYYMLAIVSIAGVSGILIQLSSVKRSPHSKRRVR